MTEEKEKKTTNELWCISLMADCLHCDEYIDLFSPMWHEHEMRNSLPVGKSVPDAKWDSIECPKCGKEFTVKEAEY